MLSSPTPHRCFSHPVPFPPSPGPKPRPVSLLEELTWTQPTDSGWSGQALTHPQGFVPIAGV